MTSFFRPSQAGPSRFKVNIYSLAALLTLLTLAPAATHADIYKCDGKWTNRPCTGTVSEIMKEEAAKEDQGPLVIPQKPAVENPVGQNESTSFDPKRYEKARKLRRSFDSLKTPMGSTLDRAEIESAADICNDSNHSDADCNEAYDQAMTKIENAQRTQEDAFLGKIE